MGSKLASMEVFSPSPYEDIFGADLLPPRDEHPGGENLDDEREDDIHLPGRVRGNAPLRDGRELQQAAGHHGGDECVQEGAVPADVWETQPDEWGGSEAGDEKGAKLAVEKGVGEGSVVYAGRYFVHGTRPRDYSQEPRQLRHGRQGLHGTVEVLHRGI